MKKIEYGNVYKFLVSLGLFFVFSPFVGFYLFISRNDILISQTDMIALSDYSLQSLEQKNVYIKFFIEVFPYISGLLILLGLGAFFWGIYKWKKNQDLEDAILDSNKKKAEKELEQMTPSEILQKAAKESGIVNMQPNIDAVKPVSTKRNLFSRAELPQQNEFEGDYKRVVDNMAKYLDVEDRVFNYYFNSNLAFMRRHFIKRNVKIGSHEYDYIAISTLDNVDKIYEVKYWTHNVYNKLIDAAIEELQNAGINYERRMDRKCELRLFVVFSDHGKEKFNTKMEKHLNNIPIVVECINETDLPK